MNKLIKISIVLFVCLTLQQVQAQAVASKEIDSLEKPYHPDEDAQEAIDSLLVQAKATKKNIIIQAGGNWCIWCLRFNNYIHEESDLNALIVDHLLYYHLNYSKENKNEAVFNRYAPDGAKLGYPFFIVLNSDGKVLAVRDSGSLEDGKGYDKAKVTEFFQSYITL